MNQKRNHRPAGLWWDRTNSLDLDPHHPRSEDKPEPKPKPAQNPADKPQDRFPCSYCRATGSICLHCALDLGRCTCRRGYSSVVCDYCEGRGIIDLSETVEAIANVDDDADDDDLDVGGL